MFSNPHREANNVLRMVLILSKLGLNVRINKVLSQKRMKTRTDRLIPEQPLKIDVFIKIKIDTKLKYPNSGSYQNGEALS